MAQTLTLDFQQYSALVYLAREGARLKGFLASAATNPQLKQLVAAATAYSGQDADGARQLESFLVNSIEVPNGGIRYFVAVRWTELASSLPPRTAGAPTRFPENWPPNLEGTIELLTRPVARADVDQYLQANAKNPTSILCTKDPGLQLGWTPIDSFFV